MENSLVGRRCYIISQGETEFIIKALDYTIENTGYSQNLYVSGVLVEKQTQVQEGLRVRIYGTLSHYNLNEVKLI